MDAQTREKIGFPQFGEAVNRKIRAVRDALTGAGVDPPEQPLVFYVGGVRVSASWSGDADRNTGIVRVTLGDPSADPVSYLLPAPWVLNDAYSEDDVAYLLAQDKPAPAAAAG